MEISSIRGLPEMVRYIFFVNSVNHLLYMFTLTNFIFEPFNTWYLVDEISMNLASEILW